MPRRSFYYETVSNELADMYQAGELEINPAFQRAFRWSEVKQSQFIESLVLELPLPPIYVIEGDDGRFELIDGLQRFSSYLNFRGLLRGSKEPLKLVGCDLVPELNGHSFEGLPTGIQIRTKRIPITVQVLRKESDRRLKFHMFRRLNTGGEALSAQEIRNATIRLLNPEFNEFLQKLAKSSSFQRCTEIMTEDAKQQMAREECVLRFFAFKNARKHYTKLISPFLDNYMEAVSDKKVSFDYGSEEATFDQTFQLFAKTLEESAFSTVTKKGGLGNQFSQAHFDFLTQGVQADLEKILQEAADDPAKVIKALTDLKTNETFRRATTGGGKNYAAAYGKNISFVESWMRKCLHTA